MDTEVNRSATSNALRFAAGVVLGLAAIATVWVVLSFVPVLWVFALMIGCLSCIGAGVWGYRTFDGDRVAVGVIAIGVIVAALAAAR